VLLDRFIQIIEENNLSAEEIEKVEFTPIVSSIEKRFTENQLKSEQDLAFHGQYLVACAAHRIKPIDMANPNTKNDPKIVDFMKKVVKLSVDKNFGKAILEDPEHLARLLNIEVRTKGKTFKAQNRVVDWTWNSEVRAKDEDLIRKFKEVTSGFLPPPKTEKAVEVLYKLEDVKNVNDLTKLLVP
jgi:2-methylcitrate dehydratase PrpD